jgi:hypothetical protein
VPRQVIAGKTQPNISGTGAPYPNIVGPHITPIQQQRQEAQRGALENTIQLIDKVYPQLDKLNSLVDRGRLQFVYDHNSISSPLQVAETAIANNLPLSEDEASMIANMKSLAEHINTLRGPLGATGFRGPEAFAALQGQAGSLMQRPEITRTVMENSLRALLTQRRSFASTESRTTGKPMMLDKDTAKAYYFAAPGKTPEEKLQNAKLAVAKDGYQTPKE